MRYNESGPDTESLPFVESRALSHEWTDFLLTHDRLLFDTWDIVKYRLALSLRTEVANDDGYDDVQP